MLPILALDSAGQTCSVALAYQDSAGAEKQAERQLGSTRNFETQLVPLVQEVCTEAKLQPQDLSAVVITLGPGSYTGQRLALCFASGLRVALGIRSLGFTSTLLAARTAQRLLVERGVKHGQIAVLLDSRRAEPFAQCFSFQGMGQDIEQGTEQDTKQGTEQDTKQGTEQDTKQGTEQDTEQGTGQGMKQNTGQGMKQNTEQNTKGLEATGEIVSLAQENLAAWLQEAESTAAQTTTGESLFVCGDALSDDKLAALVAQAVPKAEILSAIGRGRVAELVELAREAMGQPTDEPDKPLQAAYVREPDISAPRRSFLEGV